MKQTLILLSLTALIVGCAHDHPSGTGATGAASGNIAGAGGGATPEAANFARQACHAGVAQAEIGKLAATNTKNEGVRNLAKSLVKEHSQTEKDLDQLLVQKGVTAEPQWVEQLQSSIDHLATLKGSNFDRAFQQQVIADSQKAIAAYEQEVALGTDPNLKAFAERHLPQLRMHLAMAEQLEIGPPDTRKHKDVEAGTLQKAIRGAPFF